MINQIHIPLWDETILASDGGGGFIHPVPATVQSLALNVEDIMLLIAPQTLRTYAKRHPEKVKEVPVTYK